MKDLPGGEKNKLIRFRCWVDVDGRKFFGPGRADLLRGIEETGSIARAARAMNMSYKKAWVMIKELNSKGKKPFVVIQKGGVKGGGALLTVEGRNALKAFDAMTRRINAIVKKEKNLLKFI